MLIKALVIHIMSHEQARRIIADPVPENQVSIAVLEKTALNWMKELGFISKIFQNEC
ncbi:acetyltransferase [Enterococcus gallinarum]|nr:acetyltransferase [Enterococcus gallinarum]